MRGASGAAAVRPAPNAPNSVLNKHARALATYQRPDDHPDPKLGSRLKRAAGSQPAFAAAK